MPNSGLPTDISSNIDYSSVTGHIFFVSHVSFAMIWFEFEKDVAKSLYELIVFSLLPFYLQQITKNYHKLAKTHQKYTKLGKWP